MSYLIKASVLIAIFYLLYKIFLQKDTFFQSNRWFLLTGLLVSLVAPLIIIPIYIEQAPIVIPNVDYELIPVNNSQQNHSFLDYLPHVYLLGMILFALRLLVQLTALGKLIFKNKEISKGQFIYVEVRDNVPPFSFFKWIVYNPSQFNKAELDQILAHEKVHARQLHSIDVLLSQLICVFLWFNPFIWLYSINLKQNLEFLADCDATNYVSCKKSYQYTLLKTSMPTHQLALSNPFYNSLIKKRIVMLQKSKSKKINQIKYALVVPILAVFLMSFNTKTIFIEKEEPEKIIEQEPIETTEQETKQIEPRKEMVSNLISAPKEEAVKPQRTTSNIQTENPSKPSVKILDNVNKHKKIEFLVFKTSTDSDLEKIVSKGKKNGLTISFKSVKRNDKGEITSIKITAKSESSNANYNLNSNESISPIIIAFNKTTNSLSIGNANVIKKDGNTFAYKTKTGNHGISSSGKGSNVVVITEEEDNYKVRSAKANSKVEIISTDSNDNVEVIVETDVNSEGNEENEDEIIVISEDKSDIIEVRTVAKSNKNGNIVITTEDDKNPLFIIDGKEVEKGITEDLKPESIESINVLKGDSAEKKYGEKGENGVIEITTKK